MIGFTLALAIPASAREVFVSEFEVAGLSCDLCSANATKLLRKLPGVVKAEVVYATRKGRVEATRKIERDEIRRALAKSGFEAHFAGDSVARRLSAEERARLDIRVVSNGEPFDIRKNLAPGKYTIFDFWAEWCGPCHVLTPKIERLVQQRPKVALRTINLQSWESAAAKQATKELKLAALPYVRVYDPSGKFLGAVVGNDIEKIERLIAGK